MGQARLDRETVVREALLLLDRVGFEGLTVRRLARELDVQAPALYWHFRNKEELLDQMAAAVFTDAIRGPDWPPNDANWAEWTEQFGKCLRETLLRYRDGARIFSGRYLTDAALFVTMEAALRKFTAAGFSLQDAAQGLNAVYCYAVGFAIEEQAVYPRPGKRRKRYDLTKRAKRLDPQNLPLAVAVGEYTFADFGKHFERGLRFIIRGMSAALDERTNHAPTRRRRASNHV